MVVVVVVVVMVAFWFGGQGEARELGLLAVVTDECGVEMVVETVCRRCHERGRDDTTITTHLSCGDFFRLR